MAFRAPRRRYRSRRPGDGPMGIGSQPSQVRGAYEARQHREAEEAKLRAGLTFVLDDLRPRAAALFAEAEA